MRECSVQHLVVVFVDGIFNPADVGSLPPYLQAHMFFHRFHMMNIGVACTDSFCGAFFALAVHHCYSSCCSEEWSNWKPVVFAKVLQTLSANYPVLKMWSMMSIPALSRQQKQCNGSMPKLDNILLVGILLLRVLHNKKKI